MTKIQQKGNTHLEWLKFYIFKEAVLDFDWFINLLIFEFPINLLYTGPF